MAFENGIVAEMGRRELEEIEWRRENAVVGANLTDASLAERSISGVPSTRSFDRRSLVFFIFVFAVQVIFFCHAYRAAYRSGTKLETLRERFAAQQKRLKSPSYQPSGRKSQVEAFHRKLARFINADAVAAAGIYAPDRSPSFVWARSSLAVDPSDPAYLSAVSATSATASASQIPDSIV